MATFINREKEITYLKNWLDSEPNSLLFVYGPKSGGKSTLISKLIEDHVDHAKYAINYLSLREIAVRDFQSFLDAFFIKTTKDKVKDIVAGISMNIGFFKMSLDDEAILKENPFRIMVRQLVKAKKKGIQPVIIIDEIQALKNIYTNGEQNLLDQLFNLFVRLTKELHVAHVILLTSDSYFIEEIYVNAKLKKTTEFYYVGHLSKSAVETWLIEESLNDNDIQYIWNKLGGSAWEITQVISKHKNGQSIEDACEYFINDEYAKLMETLRYFSDDDENIIWKVNADIVQRGFASMEDLGKTVNHLIPKMVEKDVWFYRSHTQQITANSESIRWAMKRMLDN